MALDRLARSIWHRIAGNPIQPRATGFTAEFDADFYRASHADLRHLSAQQAHEHFLQHGRAEGRPGAAAALHHNFLDFIPNGQPTLEIGPFFKPLVSGPQVKYFDIYDTETLRNHARNYGGDPDNCPHIDYVSSNGDLTVIPDKFAAVFSSHCIEHQPDLIRHFSMVADLLDEGGHYYLLVPDKRYCFDHFLPESTIADVLDAHLRARRMNEPRNVLQYRLLRTHNDPGRHWAGDHGQSMIDEDPAALAPAIEEVSRYRDVYLDTHNWQFTAESFKALMARLQPLGLFPLETRHVYNTVRGTAEFGAILRKVSPKASG